MPSDQVLADRNGLSAMDRRRFLQAGASLAALASFALRPGDEAWAAPSFSSNPFSLGIASGDQTADGVVLWTRLAPSPLVQTGGMPRREVPVQWQLATDEGMSNVVRSGAALAAPQLVHSVHVELEGLEPARDYYYQFKAGHDTSPIGRTKTAPAPGAQVDELKFAFASCQAWPDGYYSAYNRMAEEDLDLVVHLGDYIYESGIDRNGGNRNVFVPGQFRSETKGLQRYRLQHSLYKTDPDLQAAHARFPWIVTWDDHEVENDYTDAIPQDPSTRFLKRRAAAYRAYYEHLPLGRRSFPHGPNMRIYRDLMWGNLAQFRVLDTRQYRDDHPCGDGETPRCAEALDPSVTMTGPPQERWLLNGLERDERKWNIIAQQVLMAELDHKEGPGKIFWNDSWDGYPLARARILRHLESRNINNPVVITGDWHSTFVNDLLLNFNKPESEPVATEFVGTSISTNGDAEVYGPYYGPFIPFNEHIKFFDGDRRGYVRCTVDQDQWVSDLRMVTTVSRRDAPVYTLASFAVENGRAGAHRI
ncbi:MAG: alkaline phosphatase D family protein [Actinobacteria bacterium]|nr:alkaline phosphatase D family protein [Actinomycetota bacterium]